jgi:hypothetical protein
VLTSYIIQSLAESGKRVIYFFCSSQYTEGSRGAKRDETLTVIRTLIYQLALANTSLFHDILKFRNNSKAPGTISVDYFWELFISCTAKFEQLYCVIDGLDECVDRENEQLLSKLMSLETIPGVRTLIVSRNVPDIYAGYNRPGRNNSCSFRITPADLHEDSESFILAEIKRTRLGDLSQDFQDTIFQKVRSASEGLFLYSRLLLSQLSKTADAEEIRDILGDLPAGLKELYEKIYEQLRLEFASLGATSKYLAKFILAFAVFGARPLRVEEFSEARLVEHGSRILSKGKSTSIYPDKVQNIERLVSPFVEVVGGRIRLIHHSAKQFLEEKSQLDSNQIIMNREHSHQRLLECCLDYLLLSVFREPLTKQRFQNAAKEKLVQDHPFMEYAAQHWSSHLQPDFDTPSPKSAPAVIEFLSSKSFITWVEVAITLSSHLENIGFITSDIEKWIARAPDGHPEVFRLSKWLQDFRKSVYDWFGAIMAHPSEVHYIDDFAPLGSKSHGKNAQKLMAHKEEWSRRIFPCTILDYNYFIRHESMIALARKECDKVSKDHGDDVIAMAIHDWYLGNCLKVLRFAPPSIPNNGWTSIRTIAFSPDGKFIAGTVGPRDTDGPWQLTTYIWPVDGSSEQPIWSHTSDLTESFHFSVLDISFPSVSTILCPSGLHDVGSGKLLTKLPDHFQHDCCSLTFRSGAICVIRSTHTLEVWRVNPVDPECVAFDMESKIHVRHAFGGSLDDEEDSWVIRDISTSGQLVLLTDYTSIVTFNARKEEVHLHYSLEEDNKDIRACFSYDEKKIATFVTGYKGQNYHGILLSPVERTDEAAGAEAPPEFTKVRTYVNMKPPEYISFDFDSDYIHTCSVQRNSMRSMVSVFHTVDCRQEWDEDADWQPRENQEFAIEFSQTADILHVSAIPSPTQPLVLDSSCSFRTRSKDDDDDEYSPGHW